jgi:hypothetical protein
MITIWAERKDLSAVALRSLRCPPVVHIDNGLAVHRFARLQSCACDTR